MSTKSQLSRRNVLQAMGIGTASLAVAACQPVEITSTNGSIPASTMQMLNVPPAVAAHRATLGDFTITILRDGLLQQDAAAFGVNAEEGAVGDLLSSYNLPTSGISLDITALLVETPDSTVLVDTGAGDFEGLGENTGRLMETLSVLGVQPEDIDSVILSHFHPDHLGGATLGGEIAFPNAQHFFPEAEWDFIQSEPPEQLAPFFEVANAKLDPIVLADQLSYYGNGEILPGFEGVAAPGHTPGHHAVLIGSGDAQLLFLADTITHPIAHFEHPEWAFSFDTLPDVNTETRQDLLGRAADEGLHVYATHLPFPGLGYVSRDGETFRFVAG